MCAIYGDKSRWAGVGKARLSGSCQGQIINHHLVDGPGQGCLRTLLGGTVTGKYGPREQPLPWTVSKNLYLRVKALLPHRTGLVPKIWKTGGEENLGDVGKQVMLTPTRKGLNPQWRCGVCLSLCLCGFPPDHPGSSHRTKDNWVTTLLKDCKHYRSPTISALVSFNSASSHIHPRAL